MKVSEYNFRSLINKMVYIDGNVCGVVLDEFPSTGKVTGYVGYGYIDHQEGVTFEVMACAYKNKEDITVYPGNDYMTFKYRLRSVSSNEAIILNESQYDTTFFEKKVERINALYNEDPEIAELREITEIDHLRSPEFPDDFLVTMYKEGLKMERAWVRMEGLNEVHIQGRLLHELTNKEYELQFGDLINISLMEDNDGNIVSICFVE